jgi:hypothetical protein
MMSRARSTHREMNAYILVGNPGGRRTLKRPRCSCEDNIKVYVKAVGLEGMDWINVAKD